MKILVTGATGMVGKNILDEMKTTSREQDMRLTYHYFLNNLEKISEVS